MSNLSLLNLSIRTQNALVYNGVDSIERLLHISDQELQSFRGLGAAGIDEIREALSRINTNHLADNNDFSLSRNSLLAKILEAEVSGTEHTYIFLFFNGIAFVSDIPLGESEFDVKIRKRLNKLGITSLRSLANLNFRTFHMLFMNHEDESKIIEDYLLQAAYIILDGDNFLQIIERVKKKLDKDLGPEEAAILLPGAMVSINTWLEGYGDKPPSSQEKTEIINGIYHSDFVFASFGNYILSLFGEDFSRLSAEDIVSRISAPLARRLSVTEALRQLVLEQKLSLYDTKYVKKFPSIDSWVESLEEGRAKEMFLKRLNGASFKTCGADFNVSTERARQIINNLSASKPILDEDKYSYWFQKYCLSKGSFCEIFSEPERVYYYLNTMYQPGKEPLSEIVNDENCDTAIREKCYSLLRKNMILIDGNYIAPTLPIILKQMCLERYPDISGTAEFFFQEYNDYLQEKGLADGIDSGLQPRNLNAFKARLERVDFLIPSKGHTLRFYLFDDHDPEDLAMRLNLMKYNDTDLEIGSAKLFYDNKDLMQEFDIRDEYELHNFLKRSQSAWDHSGGHIVFGKAPTIYFGNPSREQQALKVLSQVSPATIAEFAKAYSEEYGMQEFTAASNLVQYIKKYEANGIYSIHTPIISEEEANQLKQVLTEDFYTMEEFEAIFNATLPDSDKDKINNASIRKLQFLPYSSCIVSGRYRNSQEYFEAYFNDKTVIDRTDANTTAILSNLIAYNIFCAKLENYEYLEFENKKYINIHKLHASDPNVTRDYINKYVESVIAHMSDRPYFTIKQVLADFSDPVLDRFCFDDIFYESILIKSGKIKNFRLCNRYVFIMNQQLSPSTVGLLMAIVEENGNLDIYKLVDILKEEYGIMIEKDAIIQRIKESPLYYDSIMETIYLNREEYYKDIRRRTEQ